jgi:hypothetical protein
MVAGRLLAELGRERFGVIVKAGLGEEHAHPRCIALLM